MTIDPFPFQTLNWEDIPEEIHAGETGRAYWQVRYLNAIRVRKVKYSAGYKADHWCKKGHVLHCVEGEMETELEDGRIFILKKGMTYLVGDNNEAHRSSSHEGCQLFIVD